MNGCFKLIIYLVLLGYNATWAALPCTISLTYKENGKPGYMEKSPSNEGLYKAIYTEVAQRLNCTLSIERYPKKRTHQMLKHGSVDLYPSTGFNKKRSKYLFYVPNGLNRFEPYYGLSPKRIKNIESIQEIEKHRLVWVFEAGNTTVEESNKYKISYQDIVGLIYERAIKLI